MAIAAAKAAEEMAVVDAVADAAADEEATAVVMVLLPASRPLACQLLAAMMLRRQATRRNFAAPIKAAPAPKLTTHLRASIMLNLFSITNASARRPPALPSFALPSPAINLAVAPLSLIILVCLILIHQLSMSVCYSSIHRHVSTTVLFLIMVLLRARDCHLLCHDRL